MWRAALKGLKAEGGGSSQAPARALLLSEPPSADAGEITDKGYINQRAVLKRRDALVQALYAGGPGRHPRPLNPGNPMTRELRPAEGLLGQMTMLRIETDGPVVHLRLNRPDKRNALNETLVRELQTAFVNLPKDARVAVLSGEGAHFSAGLDLSEVTEQSVAEGIVHSRKWHAAFDLIQFGPVPVIAVLHGAVVGGGLELAATAHLRVAEASSFYGLPEGPARHLRRRQRLGAHPAADGRVAHDRHDAHRPRLRCRRRPGRGPEQLPGRRGRRPGARRWSWRARSPATRRCPTTPITQALPRIAEMAPAEGLFVESLMSAIAQGDEAAKTPRARLPGKARRQGGQGHVSKTYVHRVAVQFGHCDPAGIVFFPNFSRWMDESSLAFFMACGVPPWRELVKTRGIIGTPLLEIHTKFYKTATYGETIEVHTTVEEWMAKTFRHRHVIRAATPCCAKAPRCAPSASAMPPTPSASAPSRCPRTSRRLCQ